MRTHVPEREKGTGNKRQVVWLPCESRLENCGFSVLNTAWYGKWLQPVRTEGDKHRGADKTELQLSPGTKINKLSANAGSWRSYSHQALRSKETEEPLCHNNERKKKSFITLKTVLSTFQRDYSMFYPWNTLFNLGSPNHNICQLQFLKNWNVVFLLSTISSDLRKFSEKIHNKNS